MKQTKSAQVILGILSKDDQSGYDIKNIFTKVSRFYWSESNAQIYPTLKKLEAEKMVTSKLDKSSGNRKKRIFSITSRGLEVVRQWLLERTEPTAYREEILLKLGCAQNLSKAELKQILEDYRFDIQQQLRMLDAVDQHILEGHAGQADQPHLQSVYAHVRLVLEAKLKWVESQLV